MSRTMNTSRSRSAPTSTPFHDPLATVVAQWPSAAIRLASFSPSVKHAGIGIRQQLGQAIEHTAHAVEIVDPTALAIRLALAETLRAGIAQHLIEQRARFVRVGIRVGVSAPRLALGRRYRLHGVGQHFANIGIACATASAASTVRLEAFEAKLAAHVIFARD